MPVLFRPALLAILLGSSLTASAYGLPKPVKAEKSTAVRSSIHVVQSQSPQMPHVRQALPPSLEQSRYRLPELSNRDDLQLPKRSLSAAERKQAAATAACQDMVKLASYSGNELADYIVNLPSYECHYGLFSLNATQAAKVFTAENYNAVAARFAQEAAAYDASNRALVNLTLYLRAGYFLAGSNTAPAAPANLLSITRPAIAALMDGDKLFKANALGKTTAYEVLTLVTNQNDEVFYLPRAKSLIERYTNSPAQPNAANALNDYQTGRAFTGALTILYYAHWRAGGGDLYRADGSYLDTLYNFVRQNKAALLGKSASYQLVDVSREAYRFGQYSSRLDQVRAALKETLDNSSMTGPDADLWFAAAESVDYYDYANCASYGTCNYRDKLANSVLKVNHNCSPSLRIRAQEMTAAQLAETCSKLSSSESYFHKMLQTSNKPVANDNNTALEVVVFDDYSNYDKYAGTLFGISTDNGGMYLEGDPSRAGNQARFIAHEASWLRPTFQIWNLEHEYIHYLDGRFDMYGDFMAGMVKPTVWWTEGLAEYVSLKNNNQKALDEGKKATYKLSTIFANSYDVADYTNRVYRWGYLATRFMFEKKRGDVDKMLARFRTGDYSGYQGIIDQIGSSYDSEFASWAQSATTAGEPPLPNVSLPACASDKILGNGCSIKFGNSTVAYAYVRVPYRSKNLKIWTTGGTGEMDMYVAFKRFPDKGNYDWSSTNSGNEESVTIASPTSGNWYYIQMTPRQAYTTFNGVTINASYDVTP